jgi:hypothetical protein
MSALIDGSAVLRDIDDAKKIKAKLTPRVLISIH